MRRQSRPILRPGAALAWLAAAAALLPTGIEAQLDLDRLELFLRPDGGFGAGTFVVSNPGADPVTAQLAIEDWERAEDGTNLFREAGCSVPQFGEAVWEA